MKKNQLNREEEILRDKLNEVEFDFQPGDWNALEKQLPSSGGSTSWLSGKAIIGAAVVVSLTAAWFVSQDDQAQEATPETTEKIIKLESADQKETASLNDESDLGIEAGSKNEASENAELESNIAAVEPSSKGESIATVTEDEPAAEVANTDSKTPNTVESETSSPVVENLAKKEASHAVEKPIIAGLSAPDRVCQGEFFTIALDLKNELPKEYKIDWIIEGKVLASNSRISSMKLQDNGVNQVNQFEIKVKDEHGELYRSFTKVIQSDVLPELEFTYADMTDPYDDFSAEVKVDPELYQSYQWFDEDDRLLAQGETAKLEFDKKGIYDVVLKAKTENGCYRILEKPLAIYADFDPLAPNAFTPLNHDGTNDTFMPEAFKERNDQFEMQIMTLDGGLVYETKSVLEEWNGKQNNTGQMMPAGQYFWKVIIRNTEGKSRTFFGNIRITP